MQKRHHRQERCTAVRILPSTVRMAELTSSSCPSYRKSPALGLMSTCKGIRKAARTAFMSPAQNRQSLQHLEPAFTGGSMAHGTLSVQVGCCVVYLNLE